MTSPSYPHNLTQPNPTHQYQDTYRAIALSNGISITSPLQTQITPPSSLIPRQTSYQPSYQDISPPTSHPQSIHNPSTTHSSSSASPTRLCNDLTKEIGGTHAIPSNHRQPSPSEWARQVHHAKSPSVSAYVFRPALIKSYQSISPSLDSQLSTLESQKPIRVSCHTCYRLYAYEYFGRATYRKAAMELSYKSFLIRHTQLNTNQIKAT